MKKKDLKRKIFALEADLRSVVLLPIGNPERVRIEGEVIYRAEQEGVLMMGTVGNGIIDMMKDKDDTVDDK